MSNFVVVNTKTWYVLGQFETLGAAKRSATCAMKRVKRSKKEEWYDYVAMSIEEFREGDTLVETRNLLNPDAGPIMIRRSQKGGCCDPGTETYWSM